MSAIVSTIILIFICSCFLYLKYLTHKNIAEVQILEKFKHSAREKANHSWSIILKYDSDDIQDIHDFNDYEADDLLAKIDRDLRSDIIDHPEKIEIAFYYDKTTNRWNNDRNVIDRLRKYIFHEN